MKKHPIVAVTGKVQDGIAIDSSPPPIKVPKAKKLIKAASAARTASALSKAKKLAVSSALARTVEAIKAANITLIIAK
ncbi:hypothetical protein [Borrelia hispanica]|uniref:hypothetical protein n=1 Tax=Borrelia hispanica TaxID=40835 RepID=UPI000463B1B5|nr:hypothetical protein [Borrelia hispanica]